MRIMARTLAAAAVVALLLVYVWERVEIVRVGYHVERLKVAKAALQRERDELRVKASALTAPERLARVAREQLGMLPPQQGQVILVRAESPVRTVPGRTEPPMAAVRVAKGELASSLP